MCVCVCAYACMFVRVRVQINRLNVSSRYLHLSASLLVRLKNLISVILFFTETSINFFFLVMILGFSPQCVDLTTRHKTCTHQPPADKTAACFAFFPHTALLLSKILPVCIGEAMIRKDIRPGHI